MEIPSSFAYSRPWPFAALFELKRCPALFAARAYSCSKLADLRQRLQRMAAELVPLETVALVGSLGRLEAHSGSDFDVIVVVSNDQPLDGGPVQQAMDVVLARLAASGLRQPKTWGIYRKPTTERELCDPKSLGSLAESPNIFGKRIQLLLDAQPAYGDTAFRELQRSVLHWYATGFVEYDPEAEWVYLLNDLMRYFRSYAAWQQYEFKHEPTSSWYSRIAKLQHSRVLTYAALLVLLGECSRERTDKIGWLARHLVMTPLERIAFVYQRAQIGGFDRLIVAFERFAAVWNDPATRQFLLTEGPRSVSELPARMTPVFADVLRAAKHMKDELIELVSSRSADWSPAFRRYLWF
jgi:hypothetical protein